MFKTKLPLVFFFFLFISNNIDAQIGPQQIITTNADGAFSVYATDIDGDGDMDVLSASVLDSKIAWYENTDGLGNFAPQQIISTDAINATSVYAIDLDGDSDMDVLSASLNDDKIAWYENTDGLGNFGSQQIITTDADNAISVYATDIDGDGDKDVLSASSDDNKIAWYENTNGLGNFGVQQIITTDAESANSVYASDIDGDGDMDVLSASGNDSRIAWYENTDGLGNFGSQQIITTDANNATSVYATDIDGDGDMEVLSASADDNKLAWYENTDGLGNFGPQQVITTNAIGARSVHASDIDRDGDMDVLSASSNDGVIAWYENTDGLGNFGPQQIITSNAMGAFSVYTSDLNGDGSMDVLSALANDDTIAWYENLFPLSVNENALINFSVYPTPTSGILTVQSNFSIIQLEIYNISGQLVLSNLNQNTVDISNVCSGLYFIKLKDENGNIGVKKVVKK